MGRLAVVAGSSFETPAPRAPQDEGELDESHRKGSGEAYLELNGFLMVAPSDKPKSPRPPVPGARILVVEARFYDDIADELLRGVQQAVEAAQASMDVLTLDGALEIPGTIAIALDAAEKAGKPYDAVVALGCVIRGETGHYDIVAGESARALMDLSVARRIPLANGILTVENEQQAWTRAQRE